MGSTVNFIVFRLFNWEKEERKKITI
jgi:hypothetical protein